MAADQNQTILEATTIDSQESSADSGASSATSSGQTDTAAQTGVVSVTDADSSGSAKAAITGKPFVYPAYQPVVEGLDGLRLDFSHGARVHGFNFLMHAAYELGVPMTNVMELPVFSHLHR